MKKIKRIYGSLFIRIIIIFGGTAVLINLLVFVGMRWAMDKNPVDNNFGHKNLTKYADYLCAEIGSPPDPVEMKNISDRIGFDIRIDRINGEPLMSTAGGLPSFYKLQRYVWDRHKYTHYPLGRYRNRFFVSIEKLKYRYTFYSRGHTFAEVREGILVGLIMVMTSVFSVGWFLLRRLLSPIKGLGVAVENLGSGDFSFQAPEKGSTEFSSLSKAFNQMKLKISMMIQEKEQLLLDVSHEMRSPLTRMKLSLEFMEDSQIKSSIKDDLSEMEEMISQILETARINSPWYEMDVKRIDLTELVHQLLIEPDYKNSAVVLVNDANPMFVEADERHINTVLKNLINNSLKYSLNQSRPIEIEFRPDQIIVRDYGDGIPEEDLNLVFEPFYRVDKSRQKKTGGFGLGLHLCQKLIECQEGAIKLQNHRLGGIEAVITFKS
ncbi:MAG: hypothetical protein CMP10_20300 [Zetaproteobacteria bacterium]|nr:hypothetical protein [Pseudobdellovibrionaceae bacterium]